MPTLYHGTTQHFDRFLDEPHQRNTPSATNLIGVFLSECPRIAAHFTLKTDVLDDGYDSLIGSRSLRQYPWQYDPDPFLPGACVLHCRARVENPIVLSAIEWVDIVDGMSEADILLVRAQWIAQGHDSVLVEPWDGVSHHDEFGAPCIETHAQTLIVFDAERVCITDRSEPGTHWNQPSALDFRRSRQP